VTAGLDVNAIHLVEREDGTEAASRARFTGEAYVRFGSAEQAARAHECHMKMIGHRLGRACSSARYSAGRAMGLWGQRENTMAYVDPMYNPFMGKDSIIHLPPRH
jgi:hypothetical protein